MLYFRRDDNTRCEAPPHPLILPRQLLPKRRTNDFSEQYVKVTSSSTINIKRVTFTVPSRLIGHRLLAHIYDTALDLFLGHEKTLSLSRVYAQGSLRSRAVDYKHVIH